MTFLCEYKLDALALSKESMESNTLKINIAMNYLYSNTLNINIDFLNLKDMEKFTKSMSGNLG